LVRQKAQELARRGAKLIAAPSAAKDGGWVAICDGGRRVGL